MLTWLGSDFNDFASHGGPHRPQHIRERLLPGSLSDGASPFTLVCGVHYLYRPGHSVGFKEHLPTAQHAPASNTLSGLIDPLYLYLLLALILSVWCYIGKQAFLWSNEGTGKGKGKGKGKGEGEGEGH